MATKYDSFLLNTSSSINLSAAQNSTANDLPLQAGQSSLTVSGYVYTGTTPLDYVKVTLTDTTTPTNTVTGYTDGNGYYLIDVTAGTYSVSASKTGFVPYTSSTDITIVAGTSQILSNIVLTALGSTGYMIYGTVKNSSSAAIANAIVSIILSGAVVQVTETDSVGGYAAYDLVAGDYTVNISASGYAANSSAITLSSTAKIAKNDTTLAASPLGGTGSISGTITDTQTVPVAIASAWVGLYTVVAGVETLTQATLTGTAGDYIFTGLDAGSYIIKSKKTV